MPVRRPSPARLLLVLVLACLAPIGVVMATGLTGSPVDDRTETADGGGGDGVGTREPADGPGTAAGLTGSTTARSPSTTGTVASTTATTAPATTAPTAAPTTAPPATATPAAPPTTAAPPVSATDQVVDLANAARADAGCVALRIDDRLTVAAQGHSDDMAANDYFSHTSLDGRTFGDRIEDTGYPDPGGENIARGQRSAQAVHDAWMDSEGHRANILNCSFTAIGVGLNSSAWTWTQDFGY